MKINYIVISVMFAVSVNPAWSQASSSLVGSWVVDSSRLEKNVSRQDVKLIDMNGQRWTFMKDSTFLIKSEDAANNSGSYSTEYIPAMTVSQGDRQTRDTISNIAAYVRLTLVSQSLGIKTSFEIQSLTDYKLILRYREASQPKIYYLSRQ